MQGNQGSMVNHVPSLWEEFSSSFPRKGIEIYTNREGTGIYSPSGQNLEHGTRSTSQGDSLVRGSFSVGISYFH